MIDDGLLQQDCSTCNHLHTKYECKLENWHHNGLNQCLPLDFPKLKWHTNTELFELREHMIFQCFFLAKETFRKSKKLLWLKLSSTNRYYYITITFLIKIGKTCSLNIKHSGEKREAKPLSQMENKPTNIQKYLVNHVHGFFLWLSVRDA